MCHSRALLLLLAGVTTSNLESRTAIIATLHCLCCPTRLFLKLVLLTSSAAASCCRHPGVASLRGTLPWIAPEIIKTPGAVTEAVDVYSFGIVLWELWTLRWVGQSASGAAAAAAGGRVVADQGRP